ncbi:UNKNOWN [Stylonychia lemnae]|uniref:Cadg domain containing protein n=1 Tax=Stylonychia lemnae TaxID=5949 RepID=A0A078ACQ1_STYLE|nr:UNKNOWN [Stylonychia lemnae]|eukprot:CDW80030.1 UNKNOWN [Stylonychia lemnae]
MKRNYYAAYIILFLMTSQINFMDVYAQIQCFDKYPRSFGDATKDSFYSGFDIDNSQNIIVGGVISSTALDTNSLKYPFLVYYSTDWTKEFAFAFGELYNMEVSLIKFRKAPIISYLETLKIDYFFKDKTLKPGGTIGDIKSVFNQNVVFSTDGSIYMTFFKGSNKQVVVLKISLSSNPTFNSIWAFQEGNSVSSDVSQGFHLSLDQSQSIIYIGARYSFYESANWATPYSIYQVIHKISVQEGIQRWAYGFKFNHEVAIDSARVKNADQYIFACGWIYDAVSPVLLKTQLFFLKFSIGSNAPTDQGLFSQNIFLKCEDLFIVSELEVYVLSLHPVTKQAIFQRYFNIDYLGQKAQMEKKTFEYQFQSTIFEAKILNQNKYIFVGSQINPRLSISNKEGFIISNDMSEICLSSNTPEVFVPPIFISFTKPLQSLNFPFQSIEYKFETLLLVPIRPLDMIQYKSYTSAVCNPKCNLVTLNGQTNHSYTHVIEDGDFNLDSEAYFLGDKDCNDKYRVYSLANQLITVNCTLPDGQQLSVTLNIVVVLCASNQYALQFPNGLYVYQIADPIQNIPIIPWEQSYQVCDQPIREIIYTSQITPNPPQVISLNPTYSQIEIYTTDLVNVGVYDFQIKYTNPLNSAVYSIKDFSLEIKCTAVVTKHFNGANNNFYYNLEDPTLIVDFSTSLYYTNNCGYYYIITSFVDGGSALPNYISFQNDQLRYTLQTSDTTQVGSQYKIFIQAKATNDLLWVVDNSFEWYLNILPSRIIKNINLFKPTFAIKLQDLTVEEDQITEYTLPDYFDSDLDQVTMEVDIKKAFQFVEQREKILRIQPKVANIGSYKIDINLKDSGSPSLSNYYSFTIKVIAKNQPAQQQQNSSTNTNDSSQSTDPSSDWSSYDFFQNQTLSNSNATQQKSKKIIDFQAKIMRATLDGKIYLKFNQDATFTKFESDKLPPKELLKWSIESYSQRVAQIKLEFNNPELISERQNLGNQVQSSMQAAIYSSLIIQFFLQQVLSLLWGTINNLQLISHLPLFSVYFPANAYYLITFLVDLANMKLIPDFDFLNQIPLISSSDEISSNEYELNMYFQLLGYESIYIMIIMKSFFILTIIGVIAIGIDKMLINLCDIDLNYPSNSEKTFIKRKAFEFYKNFQMKFYYSWFFRIAIENYFQCAIMICASYIVIFYLIRTKPLEKSFQLQIDLFNEFTFLSCLYMCFVFTDIVGDSQSQINVGWTFSLVICFNIFVNFLIMLIIVISSLVDFIRLILKKRKLKNDLSKTVIISQDTNAIEEVDTNITMLNKSGKSMKQYQIQDIVTLDRFSAKQRNLLNAVKKQQEGIRIRNEIVLMSETSDHLDAQTQAIQNQNYQNNEHNLNNDSNRKILRNLQSDFQAIVSESYQRKTYIVKAQNRQVTSPRVAAYDCRLLDLNFGDGNYLVIDTQSELRAGWDFEQTYDLYNGQTYKYWGTRLNIYAEPSFQLHPEFNLEKAYFGEITADLTQFRANAYAEINYFVNNKNVCVNIGWNVDDEIKFTVETSMNFQDCYKVILESLCNFDNFSNKKILDACVDSNDEQVTFYTYNPITSKTDKIWLGANSNTVGGKLCYQLPFQSTAWGFIFSQAINFLLENSAQTNQYE